MEYPMHIGGCAVVTGQTRKVELPYDGTEVATVYEAGAAEVNAAVEAAAAAATTMREMTLAERAAILRQAHGKVQERADALAQALAGESGKPIREARAEVSRAAQTLLFSSEEAHRLCGEVVPMDAAPAGRGRWGMTLREPLGVIAAITPFNFPLNLAMHKIGPALAAGNAVVHKPASATPVTGLMMAALFEECGLPAGALNVVTGPGGGIGELLVAHPKVAMVTFTGSPEVGLRIRSLAGMKRVTLELGSNSAVIVESDADLDAAAARAVVGSFANSGQVCISVQRIFAHRSIHHEFLERMAAGARSLQIGHPLDPGTEISSLITTAEAERVEAWIDEARCAGARLVTAARAGPPPSNRPY
jgi:acyl-CoA reductase-like NAD-dependent aldehyde dehydrogenase